MKSGVDLARIDAPEHAAVIDMFKEQLLIVFLKRILKHTGCSRLEIPVAEADDTGDDLFAFAIRNGTFVFELRKKQ